MTAQDQVSNDEFIQRLTKLFESSTNAHSIFVTQKRVTQGAESTGTSSGTHSIVVRATDGRGSAKSGRTKFTTHVDSSAIKSFQEAYSTLLRSSTVAFLRKRDKAKERRADKLLKDKRKKIEESKEVVKVTKMGSKRGAGRRKRQQARAKAQSLRRERSRAHAANTSKGADGVHAGSSATTGAHTTTK